MTMTHLVNKESDKRCANTRQFAHPTLAGIGAWGGAGIGFFVAGPPGAVVGGVIGAVGGAFGGHLIYDDNFAPIVRANIAGEKFRK